MKSSKYGYVCFSCCTPNPNALHTSFRIVLYRNTLFLGDSVYDRPSNQSYFIIFASSCFLFFHMCVHQVSFLLKWISKYLTLVTLSMEMLCNKILVDSLWHIRWLLSCISLSNIQLHLCILVEFLLLKKDIHVKLGRLYHLQKLVLVLVISYAKIRYNIGAKARLGVRRILLDVELLPLFHISLANIF